MRLHRGEAHALTPLVEKVFKPLTARVQQVLAEGMASGELIAVDPLQMRHVALGANVIYYLSAPMTRLISGKNPLERSAIKQHRKLVVEYMGQSIFRDREHGARVAARVLADTPMPERAGIAAQVIPQLRAKKLKK